MGSTQTAWHHRQPHQNQAAASITPNCSFNTSAELNTPIRRINNLTLHSSPMYPNLENVLVEETGEEPQQPEDHNSAGMSEIRPVTMDIEMDMDWTLGQSSPSKLHTYDEIQRPSVNPIISTDFGTYPVPENSTITSSMLNKGYSKKLTTNVLSELNQRANEISKSIKSPPPATAPETRKNSETRRNKRYSGIHRSKFNAMESISSHYAARSESINLQPNLLAPIELSTAEITESHSKRRRTLNGPDEVLTFKATMSSSPIKLQSSPIRKISPSKKHMNLNKILTSDDPGLEPPQSNLSTLRSGSPTDKSRFIKPFPPSNKLRVSSLEMAGVKNGVQQPMSRKSSIPQLQKKSSIPQLQKKSSIPQLQKKPSQNFQLNPPHTLHKKSSIPQLQRKTSIPNLTPNSGVTFQPSKIPSSTSQRLTRTTPLSQNTQQNIASPSLSKISGSFPSSRSSSRNLDSRLASSNSTKSLSGKFTIPQSNTLYDKPTISSSQKSLNKFQRFKDRFN